MDSDKSQDVAENHPLTPGEDAVGLTFNPSGDEKVQRLKQLFAEAFDIIEEAVPAQTEDTTNAGYRKRKMRDAALHEVVTAQMWAVKVVTLK